MSCKVTYTDRAGKVGSVVLPSRSVAELYAKSYKTATIEDMVGMDLAVEVKVCETGTEELQKQAAKDYFHLGKAGVLYTPHAMREAYAAEEKLLAQWEATKAEKAKRKAEYEAANPTWFYSLQSALLSLFPETDITSPYIT